MRRSLFNISAAFLCCAVVFGGCHYSFDVSYSGRDGEEETSAEDDETEAQTSDDASGAPVIDASVFEDLDENITTVVDGAFVTETGNINGRDYSLTIDLERWEGNTSLEQIAVLSALFWQAYPRMYERFGVISDAPTDVNLLIENEGYEIAEQWDNNVHIHDMWLAEWPEDYDCFTHELAHCIQNGWDGAALEYDSYIERFADYCRYVYSYDDGYYNDRGWTLQDKYDEPDRESSVRFLVWLDWNFPLEYDMMARYFTVCFEEKYPADQWDEAWTDIFGDTELDGLSVDEVWDIYCESDFSWLSSEADDSGESELIRTYDVRNRIRNLRG